MADDVRRGLGWPLWVEASVNGRDERAFSLPTGTVTFLLSDVEGSTQRWEEAPEAMAVAIPRHDELLDEAIVAHGGVRPVEQGEGDSVVGAFSRASDAVAAAVAAQRALRRRAVAGRRRAACARRGAHRRGPDPRSQLLPRADAQPLRPHPVHGARRPGAGVSGDRDAGHRPSPGASRTRRPRPPSAQGPRTGPSTSGRWSIRTCRRRFRRCARWTCSATTCRSS